MRNDKRDLLDVLKAELAFLEKGGYRITARVPWRPQFLFQDSPTCLNFDPTEPQRPCSDCVLMQLVPENLQNKKIACRYIPLSERGETIDSFYRSGTQRRTGSRFFAMAEDYHRAVGAGESGKLEGFRTSRGPCSCNLRDRSLTSGPPRRPAESLVDRTEYTPSHSFE